MRFELYTDKTLPQCIAALQERMQVKGTPTRPAIKGWTEKDGRFSLAASSPVVGNFNPNGHLTDAARRGLEQIQNWRSWLRVNVHYAHRPKSCNGLGLCDLSNRVLGVVVAGRRREYDNAPGREHFDRVRNQVYEQKLVEIIGYKRFVEALRFRFECKFSSRPS